MTELVSSSADSFAGNLDADGFTTAIGPFALVSGAAPPDMMTRAGSVLSTTRTI